MEVTPRASVLLLSMVNRARTDAEVSDPGSSVDDLQQHGATGPSQRTSRRSAACEWTEGETKLMLDYYEQYFPQVGPMKKFRNKKEMFGRIAENLNKTMGITRTGEQCCSRFKTVIRRKTSATTQNKKSGNSPSDVPYDEELAKIAALDDSVEPEELRDGYGVVSRRDTGSVSSKKGSYSSSEEAEETPEFEESQSSQSTQSSSSTGQTNTAERQKTRSPRVSTSRLQDMKFFLEEIKELHAQKEAQRAARHEERKKQKEESREEKARQHKEKMAMLSRLLGITATSERENK
ncbi:DDRGK domain-containing protein 1-like [Dermacentor silvarum]|uniref:DDRGK domain-containing protein 1-like n=1 Tax=Dermacentor silvarum TaxID=543639 RepID=UPI002101BE30|nr:DDRGK domain-containing protein 1-like [Dermacentor silvarum]